ncbi:hypothetical protein ATEIFO6365_0016009300 [Aspergillus terreus]|uniref:Uncharacterized protein n=1 Tax=Aspergillus terreus TaxID=33178 RepID=A0A5M3ZE14_ASPTE|nr:hypothetical protein ATETN484_0017009800 [Aspergillus terreus]GFF21769.1 hypothetical protein ATEIFO6365_0016009300 [Aspergillus terreus]
MEYEGIPTDIPRDLTYCTSEGYVLDLLRCHDNQIRHKPNAISDEYDGRAQMAALAAMRTIHPHYLRRDLRQGPFVLTLTDLHQSNIFVDEEWHIRCLIDLEWACSLPADMLQLPWWLDDRGIDEMPEGEYLDSYGKLHDEFIQIFETQEKHFRSTGKTPAVPYAEILRTNWENGNFRFFGALDNPKALYRLFLDHIQRRFDPTQDFEFDDIVSRFCSADAAEFIERKLKDKEDYDARLQDLFEEEQS